MNYNPTIKLQETDAELRPRKIPAQRRAEETVELILETSAQLLEEVGLDGFNTNLIAEKAGLRVATIYRYFPNKLAILTALVQNWWGLIQEELTVITLDGPDQEWREIICAFIDAYVAMAKKQSGFFAIRRAMQSTPKLRKIEKETVAELADEIITLLRARKVQVGKEHLQTIVQIFLISGAAIYDLAWLRGKNNIALEDSVINELKLLSTSYLANYLD